MPAWWGFAGEGYCHRLGRLVSRMRRSGYLPPDFPGLAALSEDADAKLFHSIRHNSTHVLRHYLIDKPVHDCSLRGRAHNFVLSRTPALWPTRHMKTDQIYSVIGNVNLIKYLLFI